MVPEPPAKLTAPIPAFVALSETDSHPENVIRTIDANNRQCARIRDVAEGWQAWYGGLKF